MHSTICSLLRQEKGQPLPKFGEWDVNDPASAEGFTVIFNKARDEKKTSGQPEQPIFFKCFKYGSRVSCLQAHPSIP
ncbi:Protein kinase domain-containing protein [Psidium guajava]|nr:Protein kinase domain-containing protein [Psidium guajava]